MSPSISTTKAYHKKQFGPPAWLMIMAAYFGLGVLMRTGYCSFFS